ncbi:hypothetical protein [Streptomyces cinereoruber]
MSRTAQMTMRASVDGLRSAVLVKSINTGPSLRCYDCKRARPA